MDFGTNLGGMGGAGVLNVGTITALSNSGAISGGKGGTADGDGGAGGVGASNAGTISRLTNKGTISGGNGGNGGAGAASPCC